MEELYVKPLQRSLAILSLSVLFTPALPAQSEGDQQVLMSVLPLIRQRQLADAEQRIVEGLRQFPGSAILNNALGIVCRDEGKYDAAVTAFRAAIAQKTGYTAAQMNLATLYLKTGRKQEAADQFSAAARDTSNVGVISQAAVALAELEQYQRAIEALEKAHALDPASADISFNLAQALFLQGDCAAASNLVQSIGTTDRPDAAQLRAQIEACLSQRGSAEALNKTCREKPESGTACLQAGLALIRQEKFLPAVDLLTLAASRPLPPASVLSALGLAQFRLGRYREAIQTYSRALKAEPAMDAAREGLAFLLYMTGDLERARSVVGERLSGSEPDFYLYHLHAMILYRLSPERRADALQAVNQAIRSKPDFAPSLFLRGKIEMENGDLASALRDFEQAVTIDPKYPLPYYKLAQIYARQGDAAKAEAARRQFSALGQLREEELLARQTQNVLMPR